jgi:large subunit ribosomal protein L15
MKDKPVNLSSLVKTTVRSAKRVGRGYGSGKGGHTSGRGTKGAKARSERHILFEGRKVQKSLLRRTPLLRGKGKLKSYQGKPILISLDKLNVFRSGSLVDLAALTKSGLIESSIKAPTVKILAKGELKKPLKVALPVSRAAQKAIEDNGGQIVDK